MKSIINTLTIGMLCLCFSSLKAQNIHDAQRYTSTFYQGDARAMAVGNAFGALGANSLSSSINPAGLALYPVSNFTFSLGYAKASTDANYLGNDFTEDKFNLNLPSMAWSITDDRTETEIERNGWYGSTFTISANRRNNFNQNFIFQGTNTETTVLDRFAEDMERVWFNDLPIDSTSYGGMAYYTHLIDPVYEGDNVVGFVPAIEDNSTVNMQQRQSMRTRGAITDLNFSYAGNYGNFFMIGATLGLPILNYVENGTFEENNLDFAADNYNSMSLRHRMHDQGIGVFGQLGIIFKPVHAIRIGASIRTPTFYSINRDFRIWWNSDADTRQANIEPSGYDYNYNLRTPFVGNLSAAFVIKNFGFVSADYSYIDGSRANITDPIENSNGFDYFEENKEIQNGLAAVHQFRLGGEFVFGPFALRAGQTVTTSAYNEGYMPDNNMYFTTTTSAGIGYREAKFFLELGYQISNRDTWFQPYGLSYIDVEGANLQENLGTLNMTIGFNF